MNLRALLAWLLLSLAACSSTPPPEPEVPEQTALADGLYLVVRKEEAGKDWPALQPGQERVRFEHELMSEETRPREVLVLETGSMVPLVLAADPVPGTSDRRPGREQPRDQGADHRGRVPDHALQRRGLQVRAGQAEGGAGAAMSRASPR